MVHSSTSYTVVLLEQLLLFVYKFISYRVSLAGCTSTSSATHLLDEVNGAQKKRSGHSWYAGLTNEQRAEYLNKQRIARLKRKHASCKDNVDVTQNSSFSVGKANSKYDILMDHLHCEL
jgi:hypothetical protein